jgi:hypothetical protein
MQPLLTLPPNTRGNASFRAIHLRSKCMTWGTGCSKCGRAECGEWSGWRWSYDPIKPRWFGRYGDQTQIRGWRIGPIIFWRFNTVCTKNEQQS